jgi:hypothetical protein
MLAPRSTRLSGAPSGAICGALCGALVLASAAGAAATEAADVRAEELPQPAPVVSTLDFEASGYLSLLLAELAVPDVGSLNPVGGGAYLAIRYVPRGFPFHAFLETGGGLFATGTTIAPSGTNYDNVLSAWFLSPGIGLDWEGFRLTLGVGPALVTSWHSSASEGSSTVHLAIGSEVGVSYRFWEKGPHALSAGLRYQTVPGAKIDALCLGLQARFGSISYR